MESIELGVLEACQEAVVRQQELLPLLATALHVGEGEVVSTWALRKCKQRGRLEGTDWDYFFHGLECDSRIPSVNCSVAHRQSLSPQAIQILEAHMSNR